MELGITEETIQIAIGKTLAFNPNIQPCQACAALVDAAAILRDEDGSRMAAMIQTFNGLASADAPFTAEMATSIAMALKGAAEGSQYTSVMEYIDAFVLYIAILDTELGAPVGDSVAFVMEKYGIGIVESGNANMIAYVETCLGIFADKVSHNESPVPQNESPVLQALQPLHKKAPVKSADITALSQTTFSNISREYSGLNILAVGVMLSILAAIILRSLLKSR